MSKVGIIANPASGKDIRRLVSYASVMDNVEKTNQIKRIIIGIDSTGVDEIVFMPDYYSFGRRVITDLKAKKLKTRMTILDMTVTAKPEDTIRAAQMMSDLQVDCIITLGGDGTNRAVAKGNNLIPLVHLSTGTNNIFPVMMEPTAAGVAAGIIARGILEKEGLVFIHKKLAIIKNGMEVDMALIDAVVVDQLFVGSRAIWEVSDVREIVCTRADPKNVGLTSIAGVHQPLGPEEPRGLHLRLGQGNLKVRAAVLPGLFEDVGIVMVTKLKLGDEVIVPSKPSIIALDGEREIAIHPSDQIRIKLQLNGPPVVKIEKVLTQAALKGFFRNRN